MVKTIYDIAIPFIAKWEGLVLSPYFCSGNALTIGYGEVIHSNKMYGQYSGAQLKADARKIHRGRSRRKANAILKNKYGAIITKEKAQADFEHSLKDNYWREMREYLPLGLTDNQCAALLSFSYNCGVGALEGSTLMRKLNAGDIKGAADQFLRWNRAGGRVVRGLTRRRQSERTLFLRGDA